VKVRYFDFLGRLDRVIIPGENFEKSPATRRAISTALHLVDFGLLSLPVARRLAGSCVIYGQPRKQSRRTN
jgi:hypothetical protein